MYVSVSCVTGGRRGRDRIVVSFTTTGAISAYHHESGENEPLSWRGVLKLLCNKSVVFSRYSGTPPPQ